MKLNEKLQLLRKDRKMSQEELADAVGVSRQAVAKWELGLSYPDIDNLILLSELYQVTIDRLLKEDGECCKELIHTPSLEYKDLIPFLLRAKKATYAGKDNLVESSRIASHDYAYTEGDYHYIDTYLGGERFAGEEAVWYQGVPVWSMNYVGRTLHESFRGDFLKEALSHVPEDIPYRGPQLFQSGDNTYHCTINGDFNWFQGYEEIFCQGVKVFECHFHGGGIKA